VTPASAPDVPVLAPPPPLGELWGDGTGLRGSPTSPEEILELTAAEAPSGGDAVAAGGDGGIAAGGVGGAIGGSDAGIDGAITGGVSVDLLGAGMSGICGRAGEISADLGFAGDLAGDLGATGARLGLSFALVALTSVRSM
jgi:hypothetical protein